MTTLPAVGDAFQHPFSISQEQIARFAELTGDRNPIHLDEAAALAAGFSGCIAHGVLVLGVFSNIFGSLLHADGQVVLGMESRFMAPTLAGLPYVAVVTVQETLPEKCQVIYRTEIFAEDGTAVLTGSCRLLNRKLYQRDAGHRMEPVTEKL